MSLFTCSLLKNHNHSPPPILHRDTNNSVPQFFCWYLNSLPTPKAPCPYHFPLPSTLLPTTRILSPSGLPSRGSVDPNFLMLRTSCCFFSFQFRLPHLFPSLPPGLGSNPFPHYCYGVFYLSGRAIIHSVGVSQLYWKGKQRGWMGTVILEGYLGSLYS